MVSYEIPFTNQEVDTSDAGESAQNMGEATLGFLTLFGITAGAAFLFNRGKAAAGVDGETEIPGV
ncbi:sugar kinase [Halosegnis longus]|uniref:Sugar kinase n=1 Tax=Halosegnis longus TaxID=2216012 RepID=A0AAJ4R759_9EURY|nr:sugar kinase [Salella cibi]